MNQHQLLKEEDTSPNLNSIEIIFRNPSNDDIKIKLDLSKVKQVNQMRQVVILIS